MKAKNRTLYTQLHQLEEQFIEINGLTKALQHIQPDGCASTCLLNVIEEKLQGLQESFYEYWESLGGKG